jgi:molybdenum cofactor cytidylyltransferase
MGERSGILGLVLAAGQSRRMGRPKALLSCPDSAETFVARAVRILGDGGLPSVVVVTRPGDQPLHDELRRLRPAPHIVENPTPQLGQLASLVIGIDHAETRGADTVVVLPVDMPLVRPASVLALLEAASREGAPIARVVHAGRHGHPVLFRRAVFDRLRTADIAIGARAVLHDLAGEVLNVRVDDPGVLRDVDLPEEYRRLLDSARQPG